MPNKHSSQSLIAENATWTQVEQANQAGWLNLLPVGAACKEHGPHLPLNTDFIQAQWLAEKLAQKYQCIVWPVVSYGHYPAFVDFPGSCSVSADTFIQSISDILAGICAHSVSQVFVLNTGISTIQPLETAIRESKFSKSSILNKYIFGQIFSTSRTGSANTEFWWACG